MKDRKRLIIIIVIALLLIHIPLAAIIISGRGSTWNYLLQKEKIEKKHSRSEVSGNDTRGEDVEEGLVRLASDHPQGSLDVAKNAEDYYVALNVFDRLLEEDTEEGTHKIRPSLAKEWKVSDDGKTYSFTLRDDVYFSDGTKLTAEDVKVSFSRLLSVENSEQVGYANMIVGAEDVLAGRSDTLSGIEIIDDTHFDIKLKEAFPSYLNMLCSPACSILSSKCVREAGASYGEDVAYVIGTGPYIVTENSDDRCVLERNSHYYNEEPSVKKAVMEILTPAEMDVLFREGELDLLDLDFINPDTVGRYFENEDYADHVITMDNLEIIGLMINCDISPLNDVRVRKAIQHAIDRDRLKAEVRGGYATLNDGIFPKGLKGYSEANQGWLKYDPEEAKRLLKEADVDERDKIELVISSTSDRYAQKITQYVHEDLLAVGINADIVIYDSESRSYLRRMGGVMAYRYNWVADYDDPDNFIYSIFGNEDITRKNSSCYKDEETFERIENARFISDEEERLAEYARLERKLVEEDAVWVPFYSSQHSYVMGKRVESFEPYWTGWSEIPLDGIILRKQ